MQSEKGDVIYRGAGGNIRANDKTSEFNTFIETKVNEKNKEFMQIWSGLLPEVFDINPKEILILNPQQGKYMDITRRIKYWQVRILK